MYHQPFEILDSKHTGVTTLTYLGHVTSSVMASRDHLIPKKSFPVGASLQPSLYVSPDFVEIKGPKYVGVMTLTCHGHVTSSVT